MSRFLLSYTGDDGKIKQDIVNIAVKVEMEDDYELPFGCTIEDIRVDVKSIFKGSNHILITKLP